jgi:hypothetical protein
MTWMISSLCSPRNFGPATSLRPVPRDGIATTLQAAGKTSPVDRQVPEASRESTFTDNPAQSAFGAAAVAASQDTKHFGGQTPRLEFLCIDEELEAACPWLRLAGERSKGTCASKWREHEAPAHRCKSCRLRSRPCRVARHRGMIVITLATHACIRDTPASACRRASLAGCRMPH